MEMYLAVAKLSRGRGVPRVCLPHARLAVTYRPARFQSWPTLWIWPLFVGWIGLLLIVRSTHAETFWQLVVGLGGVGLLTPVYAMTTKTVRVPRWPLCDKCVARSRRWTIVGSTLAALGLAGMLSALFANGPGAWRGVAFLFGALTLPAGSILQVIARYVWLPHGIVDQRGEYVRFRRVSEEFPEADRQTRSQPPKRRSTGTAAS
jgi:hypothetical protein